MNDVIIATIETPILDIPIRRPTSSRPVTLTAATPSLAQRSQTRGAVVSVVLGDH